MTESSSSPPEAAPAAPSLSNNHESSSSSYSRCSVALIFSAPAIGGALFGYDIGATSFTIAELTRTPTTNSGGSSMAQAVAASPVLQGTVVAAASVGALLGSFLIFRVVADRIDRKRELQVGAVLYMMGAVLEAASPLLSYTTIALLTFLLGRLIYGVGIGITMHGAPTYLSEMSPASIRGLLVSLKEASIVAGMLLGYAVGYVFHQTTTNETCCGWAYAYACSIFLSVLLLTCSWNLPPSARWLLLQNRPDDEAREALRFVFQDHADAEFETMKRLHAQASTVVVLDEIDEVGEEESSAAYVSSSSLASLWREPTYRAPLVAGVGLVTLQQITGQPSVLSYATPILHRAGLSDWSSVLIAAFKLMATLSAAVTVERFGRKTLLYVGCTLMLVALITLALSFGSNTNHSMEILILVAMFVYIGGYQIGFGPISWLIISEVFPLAVRGSAVAIAVQVNFFLNAVVQLGVPILESLVGLNVTFGVFAILTGYSIWFVKRNVPETKGLSLEEIEQQFKDMLVSREDLAAELEPLLNESDAAPHGLA